MTRFARFVALVLVLGAGSASAEVFKLYGELNGGGMYGQGLSGTQKDDAFFAKAGGGAYGALFGARLLVFDGHVAHHQFINGDGLKTWTQFTLGLSFAFDTGSEEDKEAHKSGYFGVGFGVAFGLGTGAQVDPPLDNSEITDKGFLAEGRLELGKHLSKVFDIGITTPISWAYLFKSGSGANVTDNQYQSIQIEALLVLRANLRLL